MLLPNLGMTATCDSLLHSYSSSPGFGDEEAVLLRPPDLFACLPGEPPPLDALRLDGEPWPLLWWNPKRLFKFSSWIESLSLLIPGLEVRECLVEELPPDWDVVFDAVRPRAEKDSQSASTSTVSLNSTPFFLRILLLLLLRAEVITCESLPTWETSSSSSFWFFRPSWLCEESRMELWW